MPRARSHIECLFYIDKEGPCENRCPATPIQTAPRVAGGRDVIRSRTGGRPRLGTGATIQAGRPTPPETRTGAVFSPSLGDPSDPSLTWSWTNGGGLEGVK